MATKLGKVVTNYEDIQLLTLLDTSFMYFCEVTCQVYSPLALDQRPPNMVRLWLSIRESINLDSSLNMKVHAVN